MPTTRLHWFFLRPCNFIATMSCRALSPKSGARFFHTRSWLHFVLDVKRLPNPHYQERRQHRCHPQLGRAFDLLFFLPAEELHAYNKADNCSENQHTSVTKIESLIALDDVFNTLHIIGCRNKLRNHL